ncbi:MAG: hypothetical protein M3Y58_09575, partial [Chloroflexota bacterium]|nr:hypothetical protein [Chloroflexota bacterium]
MVRTTPQTATTTESQDGAAPADGHRGAPDSISSVSPPQRDREAATADVPERPALAPNVVMSGEMEESGFAEPQWMVQRNGQFIHLTELLYHVAEQIDGQR